MSGSSSSNHYCCVPQCSSWAKRSRFKDISFHYFPREHERKVLIENNLGGRESMDQRQAWIYVLKIGKTVSKFLKVCYLHFTKEDYFQRVAVVVAFFICWAPFHIQRLFSIYQKSSQETMERNLKIYEILTYLSGILYYVSATINPILYNIMSVKFREAFKETFFRCSGFGALHDGKPQLTYIALAKSTRGAHSITDSESHDNTVQTNTSAHKHNCSESLHSLSNQRIEDNQENCSHLKDFETSAKKDEVTYVNEP